jgi:hypothetical protein
LDHVRSCLWLAGAFGPALDRQLQRGVWRAWTFADRDVSPQRLASYAVGGHVFTGGSASEQIGRIVRLRLRRPRGVWIVPDSLAKPGDSSLREIPHETVDDTVYYLETSDEATKLIAAWDNAASASGAIGFVSTAELSIAAHPRGIDAVAAETHFLVLEAYDGDGAIYVERDRPVASNSGPTPDQ